MLRHNTPQQLPNANWFIETYRHLSFCAYLQCFKSMAAGYQIELSPLWTRLAIYDLWTSANQFFGMSLGFLSARAIYFRSGLRIDDTRESINQSKSIQKSIRLFCIYIYLQYCMVG